MPPPKARIGPFAAHHDANTANAQAIVHGLRRHLQPLFGHPSDYDRLLTAMGPAR
jgi:hypothetical protein